MAFIAAAISFLYCLQRACLLSYLQDSLQRSRQIVELPSQDEMELHAGSSEAFQTISEGVFSEVGMQDAAQPRSYAVCIPRAGCGVFSS
jgi:hypothetical protein